MAKKIVAKSNAKKRAEPDDWRITKVIAKKDKIRVEAEQIHNGEIRISAVEAQDKANPEFYKAMSDLGKSMCDRVKIPGNWKEVHRLYGITVHYADDQEERMSLIATLYVPINDMNGGLTMNTPRLVEKKEGTRGGGRIYDGQDPRLPENCFAGIHGLSRWQPCAEGFAG